MLRTHAGRLPACLLCPAQGEEGDTKGVVELELLKTDSYDDVSAALATRLGLDHPLKLRLTGERGGVGVGVGRRGVEQVMARLLRRVQPTIAALFLGPHTFASLQARMQ